jgi:hypothetical protein
MKAVKFYPLFTVAAALLFNVAVQADTDQSEATATVVTTEQASPYTYVQLEIDGEKIWYAAPEGNYSVGEEVVAPPGGLPMKDFYSKSLDRTFDMVYFVGSITRLNAPEEETLPPGHPPIQAAEPRDPSEIDFSKIERPEGGKTVAEIYAQQDKLAGKSIVVRGAAVKVANGILGKNWVHLRDGSGEEGSNDLTLTTAGIVTVGEIITVRGTLAQDRDFGSGYKYAVLLEDAEIQR